MRLAEQNGSTLLRSISFTGALVWAGTIYYLSDQPAIEMAHLLIYEDKLLHILAYSILGIFCMGMLYRARHRYRRSHLVGVTIVSGLYGLLDEYHQSFIPGRDATAGDVLADTIGGLLGALLVYLLARRRFAARGRSYPNKTRP